MTRTAAETIKHLLYQPVFVRLHARSTMRWVDDGKFIIGENTLTKSILTVILAKWTFFLIHKINLQAKGVLVEDWSKSVTLGPNAVLEISQHNNSRFSS
jgi:hypothetical protein